MKNRTFMFTMIMATLVMFGCSNDSSVSPVMPETDVSALAKKVPTNVYLWDTTDVVGSATLNRTKNGVSMTLQTTEIPPGSAITIWWVVFNDPSNCATSPCTGDDVGGDGVQSDVLYAAGHVVGGSGNGNFAAHLKVGDTSGSLFDQTSSGLKKPVDNAEIHLVVRDHGPAIPALLPEMFQTFNGGCKLYDGSEGDDELNDCDDIQFAIFQP